MQIKEKQFRKRSAILSCLQGTQAHPSAEMLHQLLQPEHPDISLATVYRNLSLFKEKGLIRSLGTVGGTERFDANTAPHVHFVCDTCHAIADLTQIEVPQQLRSTVEAATGGSVTECQLSFTGLCHNCRQAGNTL